MSAASERQKARMREYYQRNKKAFRERGRVWQERKRHEYISELGGKCVDCGTDNPAVLDFDHINNDGAEQRRATKRISIERVLSKFGVARARFQLLCKNCNWLKERLRRQNAKQIRQAASPHGSSCS